MKSTIPDRALIGVIADGRGLLRISEIAAALHCDKQVAGIRLDRAQRAGLIEKHQEHGWGGHRYRLSARGALLHEDAQLAELARKRMSAVGHEAEPKS